MKAADVEALMKIGRQYGAAVIQITDAGGVQIQFFPAAAPIPKPTEEEMAADMLECGHPKYAEVGGMCMECGPGGVKKKAKAK